MPNRLIKESICMSEDIAKLSPEAEILFYRLIVKADDYGTYYGNAKLVKNTCFPMKSDDIKCKQVESWIEELANAGLIVYYEAADERRYVQIVKWDKHQQIRAKKPKFPMFDDTCKQLISNDSKCPRNPIQSNTNPIQYESNPTDASDFNLFWDAYPKKVGKQAAMKSFLRALKLTDLDTMLKALETQKKTEQWRKDNGRYIPNPTTWLNQGRWEDVTERNAGQDNETRWNLRADIG